MVSHRSRRCQTLCRFPLSESSARIHRGPLASTSELGKHCLHSSNIPHFGRGLGEEPEEAELDGSLPPLLTPPPGTFFWVSFSTGGPAAGLGSRAGPRCGTRGSQQPFGKVTSKREQRSGRAARAEGGRLPRALPRKHKVRLRASPCPATRGSFALAAGAAGVTNPPAARRDL